MHRQHILDQLDRYQAESPDDQAHKNSITQFIKKHSNCFDRELPYGHITGSAWVINQTRDKVLLTLHAKVEAWMQMGGHSDGHPITNDVALREAHEESGLQNIDPLTTEIFDLDVHHYPARQTPHGFEHEHLHFDLRYIFEADENEPLTPQAGESLNLKWVTFKEASQLNSRENFLRMIRKTLNKKF
jgi:8-oxo-dGTP pyrophosphatase MutT (NUDIX family)